MSLTAEELASLGAEGGSQNATVVNTSMTDAEKDFINLNDPAGNTSYNYVQPGSYTADANGNITSVKDLAGLTKWINDNKGLLTAGGAALGLMNANNPKYSKSGYQGTIPNLTATRTMISAPPTKGYRPGQGGIDYGGDVTYTRTPGVDPWVNLSGTSGTTTVTPGGTTVTPGGTTVTPGGTTVTPGGTDTSDGTNTRTSTIDNANNAGLTTAQYYGNISEWIAKNPNATQQEIDDALAYFQVSKDDLIGALSISDFSPAIKYNLTHDDGLSPNEINKNIIKWVKDNPYASKDEIEEIIRTSGVNKSDLMNAFNTDDTMSAGKEWALTNNMGLDQLYKNILDYQRAGHKPEDIAEMIRSSGVTQEDINAAEQYAKTFNYAEGGMAKGRYLQGNTDGMADEIPAQIGRSQPAALSHGEFVVPADVVSHLGNGNSDAGAKKLYQMMDKIRVARTGTKKQGKKINANKFMPGGLAQAYSGGGEVKHFVAGGTTTPPVGATGVESSLSNWVGDYATNALAQGQALANMPYQAYKGPLTADASDLQSTGFKALDTLSVPSGIGTAATTAGGIATSAKGTSYSPTSFSNLYKAPIAYAPTTSDFGTADAKKYMDPFLTTSLNPQLAEARRNAAIQAQMEDAKMIGAGAYGGGRSALLQAENQRNLNTKLADITGKGYETSYKNAMDQFNADQARRLNEAQYGYTQGMTSADRTASYGMDAAKSAEQSKQFGSSQGLKGLETAVSAAQAQGNLSNMSNTANLANIAQQLAAGTTQRGIDAEGIAADKKQFEEARANPYKMVEYQLSLLQGLPLAAQNYNVSEASALTKAAQGATTVADALDVLFGLKPAKKA